MNRIDVVVESCDPRDSHAWLLAGRARLAARGWEGIAKGQAVAVRVRPEDVVLCEGHPGRTSARNVLPGHVRSVRFLKKSVAVVIDVGFPLTALVTRAAREELRLAKGTPVFVLVKATAIVPEAPVAASHRVSLVGDRGILTHERIDLLRAIERTGSLSRAAREVGITYRTAWIWAEDMNRIWRDPLLARQHGGKGGGGAVLTPRGLAVLRLADDLERRPDGGRAGGRGTTRSRSTGSPPGATAPRQRADAARRQQPRDRRGGP